MDFNTHRTECTQTPSRGGLLDVMVAQHPAQIEQAQRLRAAVFSAEFAVRFERGMDQDQLDAACAHLVVYQGERLIATARLLDRARAAQVGGFYSEQAFRLKSLLNTASENVVEVGRVCIHPQFRNAATLSRLWQGVGRLTQVWGASHLMGCASIPLGCGDVQGWLDQLDGRHRLHEPVESRCVLPELVLPQLLQIPPLLAMYLRMNARLGSQAYFDSVFHCADVLIWLPVEALGNRYHQRFMSRDSVAA